MKIELEIPDFKFKRGDFISYLIGPKQNIPITFWIQNTEISGDFFVRGLKSEIFSEHSAYILSCQEFHENWLDLGTVLYSRKDEVEKRAKLVNWDKPPVPCKK